MNKPQCAGALAQTTAFQTNLGDKVAATEGARLDRMVRKSDFVLPGWTRVSYLNVNLVVFGLINFF